MSPLQAGECTEVACGAACQPGLVHERAVPHADEPVCGGCHPRVVGDDDQGHVTLDEATEDIVQEAFLELVRAGQRGDLPDNELAWLHRVAANRVIDWSRKRARWAGHVPPSEDTEEAPEAAVLRREAHRELHAALDLNPHFDPLQARRAEQTIEELS